LLRIVNELSAYALQIKRAKMNSFKSKNGRHSPVTGGWLERGHHCHILSPKFLSTPTGNLINVLVQDGKVARRYKAITCIFLQWSVQSFPRWLSSFDEFVLWSRWCRRHFY